MAEKTENTEKTEKANPFAKLGKTEAPASKSKAAAKEDADSAAKTKAEETEKAETPAKTEKAEKDAPKSTRRTAKQVEEEYQAKQAELEAQIEKLSAQLSGTGVEGGVEVVKDRVVLEDGVGGDLRVVVASRTLVNDDWRATVTDGIRLVVGRSSAQATNSFVIPVSLAKSLAEMLAEIDEIAE